MGAVLPEGSPDPAMLMLVRWSGLAIRDAATLPRTALRENGELVLRRAKTGELVTVQSPDAVAAAAGTAEAQRRVILPDGRVVTADRGRLLAVPPGVDRRGVRGFHPHRLRDTVAVNLLTADVDMQDVSTLLGHSNVRTTESYCAPCNKARHRPLAQTVKRVNRKNPVLQEMAQKNAGGAGRNASHG